MIAIVFTSLEKCCLSTYVCGRLEGNAGTYAPFELCCAVLCCCWGFVDCAVLQPCERRCPW